MRSAAIVLTVCMLGCGDDGDGDGAAPPDAERLDASAIDAPPSTCQTLPAMGQLTARDTNPRLRGGHAFADAELDLDFRDPDVRFAAERNRYEAYYATTHATDAAGTDGVALIRQLTSPDKQAWSYVEAPALVASSAPAWDAGQLDAPSVAYDAGAQRYVMVYAANGAIGAAVSPDGAAFTRTGLALELPGTTLGDPDLALVDGTYHLFFSMRSAAVVGIGHATSTDGATWAVTEAPIRSLQRSQVDPLTGGWAPSVLYDAVHCRWELWLSNDLPADVAAQPVALANTAGIYRAESNTGASWSIDYTRARDFAWNSASPRAGERGGLRAGVDLAANGNGRLLLYVGYDDRDVPANFVLPQRAGGTAPGVTTLNIATRDLP